MGIALGALLVATACSTVPDQLGNKNQGKTPRTIKDPPKEAPTPRSTSAFNEDEAWKHLLKQVSFGPRVPGTPGHDKCRDYIVDQMKITCDAVRLQEFTHKWSSTGQYKTMWNIIGTQNWKDAKVRVLLMAHWDTRPTADMEEDPVKAAKPIPGANDGASGVAVLLELARALRMQKNDVGVMYLMTDGEDLGPSLDEMFLGAKAFSKYLPEQRPDYGILIDMIGDKDLQIPMEPNSDLYAREVLRSFYSFARDAGMSKTFPAQFGPEIADDHLALNEVKIPTIDLIDFDYAPWHTLGDTVDKCSAESLRKVGVTIQGFLQKKPPFIPTKK